MRKHILTSACSLMMLSALTFFTWGNIAFAAPNATSASTSKTLSWKHACPTAPAGHASCLALIAKLAGSSKVLSNLNPFANPTGGNAPYNPANLHSAYALPTSAAGSPTVAIVDAYNNPNLASDLAAYRSKWNLPACTISSGCLKIVNQTGGSSLPAGDTNWGLEESLDVDMVSAICENCHILVVEANSANDPDLGVAVNEAVTLGAIAVSNSYGESEFSGEGSECSSYYQHSYVAITASTGDSGLGVDYPSACPYVTGVGGTTLNSNGTETAWNSLLNLFGGAGGGCSSYISKPSWESSSVTGCSQRATGDVSAVADPNTGVYIYDTYGGYNWTEVGGTSVSSPIIASVYALAGNVSSTMYPASLPWSKYSTGCLFAVGGGLLGGGSQTYAYQTGLGSPRGTGCF